MGVGKGKVMLCIKNHHADEAPDFEALAGQGGYVSYFENEHGEQWVFIRPQGSDSATVFGGDNGWEPVDVRERDADEFRQAIAGTGVRPGMVERVANYVEPLAPAVILNEGEKAWLHTVWHVSGASGLGDRDENLVRLGKSLATRYATPAMKEHANSTDYRAAMQTFCLLVGREAGRRGLNDSEMNVVVREALRALPTS